MDKFKCKAESEKGDGSIVSIDKVDGVQAILFTGGQLKLRANDQDYCLSRIGAQELLLFLLKWFGTPELVYGGLNDNCEYDLWAGVGIKFMESPLYEENASKEQIIEGFKNRLNFRAALADEYRKGCIDNAFGHANQHKRTYSEGFQDGWKARGEEA